LPKHNHSWEEFNTQGLYTMKSTPLTGRKGCSQSLMTFECLKLDHRSLRWWMHQFSAKKQPNQKMFNFISKNENSHQPCHHQRATRICDFWLCWCSGLGLDRCHNELPQPQGRTASLEGLPCHHSAIVFKYYICYFLFQMVLTVS